MRRLGTFLACAIVAVCGYAVSVSLFTATGFSFVTLGENVNDAGVAWASTTSIYANDDVYATSTPVQNSIMDKLRGTMSTPFAVPGTATINGVEVRYRRLEIASGNDITSTSVQLTRAGAVIGSASTNATGWAISEEVVTLGGAADLWGAALTPTIVNDTDFGAVIWGQWSNDPPDFGEAGVDSIEINVHYTEAATGGKHLPVLGVGLLVKKQTGWRVLDKAA